MNTYEGLHARYYDIVYADKPYAQEARFIDALLRAAGPIPGRLLDVACGTGRHAAAFGSLGWDVMGVDLSEDLLALARSNAPSANFVQQDMRELDLGSAIVRCDHMPLRRDRVRSRRRGRAFDARRVRAPPVRATERSCSIPARTGALTPCRPTPPQADPIARHRRRARPHLGDATRRDAQPDGRGVRTARVARRRHLRSVARVADQRYFSQAEMRALLEAAGLHLRRFVPAYLDAGDINEDVFHVLAVAAIR